MYSIITFIRFFLDLGWKGYHYRVVVYQRISVSCQRITAGWFHLSSKWLMLSKLRAIIKAF